MLQYENSLWILLGDFNEVRVPEERLNSVFDQNASFVFNNFIRSAGLVEYNMGGSAYTYMSNDGIKLSKLDRVLVSFSFMNQWPSAAFRTLERGLSDHCPILLSTQSLDFGATPFKFFNSWLEDHDCREIVERSLQDVSMEGHIDCVFAKLFKYIKHNLKAWRKEQRQKEEANFKKASKLVQEIEASAEHRTLSDEERKS